MSSIQGQNKKVHYLLPLKWSLHFVMTEKEWQGLRSRVKKINPDWDKCPTCPNRCKTSSLDEDWEYDRENHIKRFVKARFICSGCHWFKTLPWRIETWLKMERGEMPPATKPPHIISCLGWTQKQVDELHKKDLARHQQETEELQRVQTEALMGEAEIRYWTADLSALGEYGYSSQEIAEFEKRMNSQG
jgi:hypothetical protein